MNYYMCRSCLQYNIPEDKPVSDKGYRTCTTCEKKRERYMNGNSKSRNGGNTKMLKADPGKYADNVLKAVAAKES